MSDYQLLQNQLKGFTDVEPYFVSVMSNAAGLLWKGLEDINWAGFYIVRDNRLVLGPFQGKTACIRIDYGKGVCGTAWEKDEVMVVPDVHEFPGHIACDSASRSEIVVPIHNAGRVVAVLDIDSPKMGRFSDADKAGLMEFAEVIEDKVEWEG